jgi:hypothetical protein
VTEEHELFRLARKLRYDATAFQATITEVLDALGRANLPSGRVACEECGAVFRGPQSLAEHKYHSHGGPEPEHWVAAEAMAEEVSAESSESQEPPEGGP